MDASLRNTSAKAIVNFLTNCATTTVIQIKPLRLKFKGSTIIPFCSIQSQSSNLFRLLQQKKKITTGNRSTTRSMTIAKTKSTMSPLVLKFLFWVWIRVLIQNIKYAPCRYMTDPSNTNFCIIVSSFFDIFLFFSQTISKNLIIINPAGKIIN